MTCGMNMKGKLDHYILGGPDGKRVIPVDVMTWAKSFGDTSRRVAETTIKQPNRLLWALGARPDYWVSTVFLGLDHNWGVGPPLIFETMVFKSWPRWKAWLSDLRWPRRRCGFFKEPQFLPPLTGWVLEWRWLGFYKLVPIPNPYSQLVRWWRSNYHTMLPLVPHSWEWSQHSEQDMDRYSTWDEAERGHNRIVAKWQKAVLFGKKASPEWEGEGE